MQWKMYPTLMDHILKASPDTKKLKLTREQVEIASFNRAMAHDNKVAKDVLIIDSWWEDQRDLWFVEPHIVKLLTDPKLSVDLSCAKEFQRPVMVCLPSDCGYHPMIVNWVTVAKRRTRITKYYHDLKIVPDDVVLYFTPGSPDVEDTSTRILEVSFSPSFGERMRTILPEQRIQEAIAGTWWENCDVEVDGQKPPQFITHVGPEQLPWSDKDMEISERHVVLALKLLMYVSSFPDALVPGLPTNKMICGPRTESRNSHFVGLPEKVRNSPQAHYRNHHLRVLRDKRFTRDALGNPRVVFVSPALVGINNPSGNPSVVTETRTGKGARESSPDLRNNVPGDDQCPQPTENLPSPS